jgi:hypothetical protein
MDNLKRISSDILVRCPELSSWLDQFPGHEQKTAAEMLKRLRFVTRDVYSEWVRNTLSSFNTTRSAVYAVRKLPKETASLWDHRGRVIERPASSLGSEDLVQSVISNITKAKQQFLLDHPSIDELRRSKVHDIVLLEDSIGTGKRVSSFIDKMMQNATFKSWWSFGWIRLNVVAFARTEEAMRNIINAAPGSNHPTRKFPKRQKINFVGVLEYSKDDLAARWGENWKQILSLCWSKASIPENRRKGYGGIMAHIVFYHSVPNNIPGIFWFESPDWKPLFPRRSVPEWLPKALNQAFSSSTSEEPLTISEELLMLLQLAKKGVRNERSLAHLLNIDLFVLKRILNGAKNAGLISDRNRLTESGRRALKLEEKPSRIEFNRSLYIPRISCVGWETIQPSVPTNTVQTEFGSGSPPPNGGAGQASLEKTDAKTAPPSLSVMPQVPLAPRKGHDAHGPQGSKEK